MNRKRITVAVICIAAVLLIIAYAQHYASENDPVDKVLKEYNYSTWTVQEKSDLNQVIDIAKGPRRVFETYIEITGYSLYRSASGSVLYNNGTEYDQILESNNYSQWTEKERYDLVKLIEISDRSPKAIDTFWSLQAAVYEAYRTTDNVSFDDVYRKKNLGNNNAVNSSSIV